MLDAALTAENLVGKRRDIADGEDAFLVRFKIFVDRRAMRIGPQRRAVLNTRPIL